MGKPAARIGDMHMYLMVTPGVPPVPPRRWSIMGPGMPTVLIGGPPSAVMGLLWTCVGPPSTVVLGSTGVFIGGKPAARMGDMTAHGGTITIGFPTVLIGEMCPGGMGGGGAGGGGMASAATNGNGNRGKTSAIATKAFKKALNGMPQGTAFEAFQVVTLLEAATEGTPLCEKCAKAASKN